MHDTALHKCHTARNFRQPELGKAGERGIWVKCAYYILNTLKPQICSIKWALPYLNLIGRGSGPRFSANLSGTTIFR